MKRLLTVLALLPCLSSVHAVHALEVLADNLAETPDSITDIVGTSRVAQEFTTGLTNFVIDSVTVAVHKNSAFTTGNLNLYFYDSTGANFRPGASVQVNPIASVSASSITTSVGDTYTWSGLNYTLSANTTYYVVLDADSLSGSDRFRWDYTISTGGTGFPSRYSDSSDDGANWTIPSTANPQQMRVTAVPEPSTFALGAIGSLMLGWYGLRKRRKSA